MGAEDAHRTGSGCDHLVPAGAAPRQSGAYKEYHEIPNYIFTLVGGHRDGWSRARRNPGFHQLNEAEIRAEVGRAYEIAVAVRDGRLRYYVDGRRFHDVTDPDPLPGGRFGLRTWSTDGWWENVEFGELLPRPDSSAAGAD